MMGRAPFSVVYRTCVLCVRSSYLLDGTRNFLVLNGFIGIVSAFIVVLVCFGSLINDDNYANMLSSYQCLLAIGSCFVSHRPTCLVSATLQVSLANILPCFYSTRSACVEGYQMYFQRLVSKFSSHITDRCLGYVRRRPNSFTLPCYRRLPHIVANMQLSSG